MDDTSTPHLHLDSTGIATIAIGGAVLLLFLVVQIWLSVRIIRQAGYSGWWILTSFIPLVNILMLFIFALRKFPVRRELETLRAALPTGPVDTRLRSDDSTE